MPSGSELVTLALIEKLWEGVPELKPVPVGPTTAVLELAELGKPELALAVPVIGAE